MKYYKVLLFILFLKVGYGQFNDIRLFEREEEKIDLRLINDTLGCLIINTFENVECILLTYNYGQDTLFLKESPNYITVKQDVFYTYRSNLPKDLILLESSFVHIFVEGNGSYDDFYYEINEVKYPVLVNGDVFHRAKIKRPGNEKINLKLYNGKELLEQIEVTLDNSKNCISIKKVELFSNYFSLYHLEELFPMMISLNGEELIIDLKK